MSTASPATATAKATEVEQIVGTRFRAGGTLSIPWDAIADIKKLLLRDNQHEFHVARIQMTDGTIQEMIIDPSNDPQIARWQTEHHRKLAEARDDLRDRTRAGRRKTVAAKLLDVIKKKGDPKALLMEASVCSTKEEKLAVAEFWREMLET